MSDLNEIHTAITKALIYIEDESTEYHYLCAALNLLWKLIKAEEKAQEERVV